MPKPIFIREYCKQAGHTIAGKLTRKWYDEFETIGRTTYVHRCMYYEDEAGTRYFIDGDRCRISIKED